LVSVAHAGEGRRPSRNSEIRVNQAQGQLSADSNQTGLERAKKGTPEGGQSAASPGTGPTAPTTCNQQNASSPACYSSTQQARPITR
jgi:hypothetical protein